VQFDVTSRLRFRSVVGTFGRPAKSRSRHARMLGAVRAIFSRLHDVQTRLFLFLKLTSLHLRDESFGGSLCCGMPATLGCTSVLRGGDMVKGMVSTE
jgi:hypothetical protein